MNSKSEVKIVQVLKDGSMDEHQINKNDTNQSIESVMISLSRSQGSSGFKELYQWSYKGGNLKCYGWYDGDAGFENKHELPPGGNSRFLEKESSVQLLFGDLFLVSVKNDILRSFDVSEYGEFYNVLYGGFDTCESDEEILSEDPETEDEQDESEEEGIQGFEQSYSDDSELEEDYNEY